MSQADQHVDCGQIADTHRVGVCGGVPHEVFLGMKLRLEKRYNEKSYFKNHYCILTRRTWINSHYRQSVFIT